MKNILYSIILFSGSFTLATAQPAETPKINLLQRLAGKQIFRIEDAEINVSGNFIRRIEIGKESAIITYFNKTDKRLQPQYEFRVFNEYGFEIGSFDEKWLLDSIEPGVTRKENKTFYVKRLDEIFEFSDINLPADWERTAYVLIVGEAK